MILEEETFEAFGYYAKDLKGYTNREIISACEFCGEFRICQRASYRPFCLECKRNLRILSKEALEFSKKEKKLLHIKQKRKRKEKYNNKLRILKKERRKQKRIREEEDYKKREREEKRALWAFQKKHHGEYCDLFNEEYKRKIRERYGNSCFLCGKWEKDNGQAFSVHHVNYDPSCGCDGAKCVCVPLCISCHSRTNANRDCWQKKIINLLAKSDYFS